MASTSESNFAAEAGEHYVLYRLYREEVLAGQAPRGTDAVDLLVQRPDGDAVEVQVKARAKHASDGGWHMRPKHETMTSPRLFYVFLNIEDPLDAIAYVVPSAKVAEVVRVTHEVWLKTPGKDGKPHKDSDFRRLCPAYGSSTSPTRRAGLRSTASAGTSSSAGPDESNPWPASGQPQVVCASTGPMLSEV